MLLNPSVGWGTRPRSFIIIPRLLSNSAVYYINFPTRLLSAVFKQQTIQKCLIYYFVRITVKKIGFQNVEGCNGMRRNPSPNLPLLAIYPCGGWTFHGRDVWQMRNSFKLINYLPDGNLAILPTTLLSWNIYFKRTHNWTSRKPINLATLFKSQLSKNDSDKKNLEDHVFIFWQWQFYQWHT